VKNVNGILVPGGGSSLNISFGISQSTNEIFHIARHVNNICNIIMEITSIYKYNCSRSK